MCKCKSAVGIGVDQSLTSTGYALWHNATEYNSASVKTTKEDDVISRHRIIVQRIMSLVAEHGLQYAAIEDYAYGTFGKQPKVAAKLCELGGQLKYNFVAKGMTVYVVNINYVKQWVGLTNKAKKPEVVRKVNALWGTNFKIKDNDQADALILARIGLACWEKQNGLPNRFPLTMEQIGMVEAILCGEDTVLSGTKPLSAVI